MAGKYTLAKLLSYSKADTAEKTMEVSLLAEVFSEMLARDAGVVLQEAMVKAGVRIKAEKEAAVEAARKKKEEEAAAAAKRKAAAEAAEAAKVKAEEEAAAAAAAPAFVIATAGETAAVAGDEDADDAFDDKMINMDYAEDSTAAESAPEGAVEDVSGLKVAELKQRLQVSRLMIYQSPACFTEMLTILTAAGPRHVYGRQEGCAP